MVVVAVAAKVMSSSKGAVTGGGVPRKGTQTLHNPLCYFQTA